VSSHWATMTDAAAMNARVRGAEDGVVLPPSEFVRRPASPRPRDHYCREDGARKRRAQSRVVCRRPSVRSRRNQIAHASVRSWSKRFAPRPMRYALTPRMVSGEAREWDVEPARDTGAFPSLQPLERALPMVAHTADIGEFDSGPAPGNVRGRASSSSRAARVTPNDMRRSSRRSSGARSGQNAGPRETWGALSGLKA